jgi:uncharacterized protein (DUF488 family)
MRDECLWNAEQAWNVTTLGYNAHGAAQALDQLLQDHRVLLIDTRYSPRSVRPAWRQGALKEKYGARYHWAGAYLGNLNYRGGPIQIADSATGIKGLCQYLGEGYRLVLLCACPDYASCHRKTIVEMLCAALPGVHVLQSPEPEGA